MYRFMCCTVGFWLAVAIGAQGLEAQRKGVSIEVQSIELADETGQLLLIGTNGDPALLPTGKFQSESGAMIIVLDGRITDIVTAAGKRFSIDGLDINQGSVWLNGAQGRVALPDGKFQSEDGVTIVVEDGTITQVRSS